MTHILSKIKPTLPATASLLAVGIVYLIMYHPPHEPHARQTITESTFSQIESVQGTFDIQKERIEKKPVVQPKPEPPPKLEPIEKPVVKPPHPQIERPKKTIPKRAQIPQMPNRTHIASPKTAPTTMADISRPDVNTQSPKTFESHLKRPKGPKVAPREQSLTQFESPTVPKPHTPSPNKTMPTSENLPKRPMATTASAHAQPVTQFDKPTVPKSVAPSQSKLTFASLQDYTSAGRINFSDFQASSSLANELVRLTRIERYLSGLNNKYNSQFNNTHILCEPERARVSFPDGVAFVAIFSGGRLEEIQILLKSDTHKKIETETEVLRGIRLLHQALFKTGFGGTS